MFAASLATGQFHADDAELGGLATFELGALADIHRAKRHDLELPGSFGDGALLCDLAPYRRMRERLLAHGYSFVSSDDLPPGERAAPELRLLTAIRKRSIPYRKMGVAFDDILSRKPDARFDDHGLPRVCLGSTTPHEGAHALLYEAALAREGALTDRRVAEAMLAGEGVAMAFEFWLALLLLPRSGRSAPIFLALNAAQNPFSLAALEHGDEGVLQGLGRLALERPASVVKLFAAAGLVANLRPKARGVQEGFVRLLTDYAGLGDAHARETKALIRAAMALEDHFRSVTAPTFFRFNDLEADYRAILELPLEHHFRAGSVFDDALPAFLSQVVDDGGAP